MGLTKEQRWERDKIERRRLKGRQRSLKNRYFKIMNTEGIETALSLKDEFIDNLKQESKLEYSNLDSDYYPIFFDNVFRALGFKIYSGKAPTVSGTQPDSPFHFAIDHKRLINIESYTKNNFAQIADLQPLSSKPIMGVSFNTSCQIYGKKKNDWIDGWEEKDIAISTSLGIGRLNLVDSKILLEGIKADPKSNGKKLLQISKKIGLSDFLNLSIDNIPIYGAFKTVETRKIFQELNVKKMFNDLNKKGFDFSDGTMSNVSFKRGLKNPVSIIKELKKLDYMRGKNRLVSSPLGDIYTSQNILRKTQEAPLSKATKCSYLIKEKKEFSQLVTKISEIHKHTSEIPEMSERIKLIEKNTEEAKRKLNKLLKFSKTDPDQIADILQELIKSDKLRNNEKNTFKIWLDRYSKFTDTIEKTKFWIGILPQIFRFGARASILITLIFNYIHQW